MYVQSFYQRIKINKAENMINFEFKLTVAKMRQYCNLHFDQTVPGHRLKSRTIWGNYKQHGSPSLNDPLPETNPVTLLHHAYSKAYAI